MTTVSVSSTQTNNTHDVSLTDGTDTYGLRFATYSPRVLTETPMSPPAQAFNEQQKTFVGGRGRIRLADDPTGVFDLHNCWSSAEGKLFQAPQWRFATGIRVVNEALPGDADNMGWWKLYGTANATTMVGRYLSTSFSATAQTADKAYMWVRRVGTPTGNLTFEVNADSAGNPGAASQTVTKTTSNITDTVSLFQVFDWSGTEALAGSTTYHVKIYGASGDTSANHWEVLVNTDGTGKMSSDNSAWSASSASPYYRIVDADTAQKWWFFSHYGALYAVSQRDDQTTASVLKINGVRGKATSATGTTLVDTNITMVADQYIGAYIRIISGTGDGQIRVITDNDTTSVTVATWDKNPDNTSEYVIYGTGIWTTATGTSGLGVVTGRPVSGDKVAYFPQGATAVRRMRVNASSHDFAADGANTADILAVHTNTAGGVQIYKALKSTSIIYSSATKAWGTNLSFGGAKTVGTTDFVITNMLSHNGLLHVMKEDGIYAVESTVRKLGLGFDDVPHSSNGKAACSQENYLWWGWGHSVERMLGASATDMLNWRAGYDGMPANRRGEISCLLAAVGWVFMSIDGGADNYSSVQYWNGMGFHEIFRGWAPGVRIRNMFYQGNPDTRGKLWLDVNGELIYIDMPLLSADPLKDTSLNFQHEGVVTTATIDVNEPLFYKLVHELKVLTDELSTTKSVIVDYQTNENVGTDTWTVLGTADDSPFEAINADLGNILKIRFRLRLQTTLSTSPTVLVGWECNGWFLPPLKYQWVSTFTLLSEQETDLGDQDHDPNTLVSWLLTQATQMKKITMRSIVPSMDNKVVTVSAPQISRDWINSEEQSSAGPHWGGTISMMFREA